MNYIKGIIAFFFMIAMLMGLPSTLDAQPLQIDHDQIYFSKHERSEDQELRLPNREGGFEMFELVASDVFEEEFGRSFPDLKSYKVFSRESNIFGRVLEGSRGIYAFLFDGKGYYAIEKGKDGQYLLSDKNKRHELDANTCGLIDDEQEHKSGLVEQSADFRGPEELRIFRLAVASAAEFTNGEFGQGSASLVQEIIASRVMALNVMYENEMSIHFNLIANNAQLTYFNEDTDGFDPDNRTSSAHSVINGKLGSSAYDIGHVFYEIPDSDFGASGVAYLYALCNNNTKGGGWTGVGHYASFYTFMGTFAHEVGHQCGAHHTYYGTDDYCEARSPGHGYEPGSGNSLMSYEGSCESHNIYPFSSTLFFHLHTLLEIEDHLNNVSCGTSIATGNTAPLVTAPEDKIIPKGTPFELSGMASDTEDEMLYYDWAQYDTDDLDLAFPAGNPDNAAFSTTAPLFRCFDPSPDGYYRSFPKLSDILDDTHTLGEVLPGVSRDIHLRLVARDKHAGELGDGQSGGAFAYDETVLTVDAGAGPFFITSQNTASSLVADGSSTFDLTWDVANTDQAPISCTEVDVWFSIDGGQSFPYLLADNIANDGMESLVIPAINTYNGRIKIKASNNYFFDINNAVIEITSSCLAEGTVFTPDDDVSEVVGSPNLDLDLMPVYGNEISGMSGNITVDDPATNLVFRNNTLCNQSGNDTYYDIYRFFVSEESSVVFTRDLGAFTIVMNLYEDSYDNDDPCASWLASSAYRTNDGFVSINNKLDSPILKPGIPYYLVISGFSSSDPTYPAPYIVSCDKDIYDDTPDPGAAFNYTYVIVDNSTGKIVAFDPGSDLSSFFPGMYSIYGLSYDPTTLADPSIYVGTDFSDFRYETYYLAFCGDLSDNWMQVEIEGLPCEITSSGLNIMDCDDNGTPMIPEDDTFSFTLNPSGNDISTTYAITGAISQNGLAYGEERTFDKALPADGQIYSIRIVDELSGCFLDVDIQAPDYCSRDCTFGDALVDIQGCSDDFSITIEPQGINLSGSYSLSGDLSLNNLVYGNPQIVGQNLDALNGTVTFVITDDEHNCSIEVEADGPATKPEISNLSIVASDCIDDTGIVQVEVSGGVEPYRYDLGAGYQDAEEFQNLAADSYTLTVRDALGCEITSMLIVPSEDGPAVELGDDRDICQGESIILDAGNEASTFEWTLNGNSIPGENSSTLEISETGNYGVVATNDFQCSTTDFMTLVVHDPPAIDLGEDLEACEGDEVLIGDADSEDSFSWKLDGSPIASIGNTLNAVEGGLYEATVTNEFDCSATDDILVTYLPKPVVDLGDDIESCEGELVELDAGADEDAFSFIWKKDGSQFSTAKKVVALQSGLYEVTVFNNACSESSSLQVTFHEYPTVSIAQDQYAFCEGESAMLEGSASIGDISWSLNGSPLAGANELVLNVDEAGNYSLEANNQNCISSASTEVIVHALPELELEDEISLCPDEMMDYFPGAFNSYLWQDGSQEDHFTFVNDLNSTVESSMAYSLTVTDENNCMSSDEGTILFLAIIEAEIDSDVLAICPGESVQLEASGGDQYEWLDATGTLDATDIANPLASPGSSTAYSVVVSESRCPNNMDTATINITVYPEAQVSAGVDTCILIGQSIELEASGGSFYTWSDPKDYLSSTFGNNPIASPLETSVFSVEITDENGCTYSDEVEICIIDDPDFVIPATSIITPNDDGKNDVLRFEGLEGFGDNQLKIFTRWGEEIFSASNYQKSGVLWDGTKYGEPLPAGVYLYVLTFGDFTIKSALTLTR